MNITLLCVGKLKEKYYKDAVAEYSKRISRFIKLKTIELPDEPISDKASLKEMENIKSIEGKKILNKVSDDAFLITLVIEGKQLTSEQLASKLDSLPTYGNSKIVFVIGGSLGLSDEVKKRSNMQISLSLMTFPHQLARVVLLEQIFRSLKINNNEAYHK